MSIVNKAHYDKLFAFAKEHKEEYEKMFGGTDTEKVLGFHEGLGTDTCYQAFDNNFRMSEALKDYITEIAVECNQSIEEQDYKDKNPYGCAIAMEWWRHKTIYHFDEEFSNVLFADNSYFITRDMLQRLPHQSFYIDISNNKSLCNMIGGEGFFVSVMDSKKCISNDEATAFADVVHVMVWKEKWQEFEPQLIRPLYFYKDYNFADILEKQLISLLGGNGHRNLRRNVKKLNSVVAKTIMYLTSVEPDVRSTERKESYDTIMNKKSKNANTSHNSQYELYEVGVRFGNHYRTWSEEQNKSNGQRKGVSVRPHSVKAHWHRYWYGKKNGSRVLRQKWVAEYFTGMKDVVDDFMPAVMHVVDEKSRGDSEVLFS